MTLEITSGQALLIIIISFVILFALGQWWERKNNLPFDD